MTGQKFVDPITFLALRLPHKSVVAHWTNAIRFFRFLEHADVDHVMKSRVTSPKTFEARRTIAFTIEIPSQFGNEN